jgi:hypothetical protein
MKDQEKPFKTLLSKIQTDGCMLRTDFLQEESTQPPHSQNGSDRKTAKYLGYNKYKKLEL